MGLKYADCTQLGAPNLVRPVVNQRLTRLRAFRWVALNPGSADTPLSHHPEGRNPRFCYNWIYRR